MPVLLAKAANADVLIWVAVLLGAVLSGSFILLSMRKRLFANTRDEDDPGSLMEQVRRMEQRGELSPEEYDRVRRALVEKASGMKPPGGMTDK